MVNVLKMIVLLVGISSLVQGSAGPGNWLDGLEDVDLSKNETQRVTHLIQVGDSTSTRTVVVSKGGHQLDDQPSKICVALTYKCDKKNLHFFLVGGYIPGEPKDEMKIKKTGDSGFYQEHAFKTLDALFKDFPGHAPSAFHATLHHPQ